MKVRFLRLTLFLKHCPFEPGKTWEGNLSKTRPVANVVPGRVRTKVNDVPILDGSEKRVDISIRRIGQEVWIEFYQAGLRVRFEQTREEITDLVTICQDLLGRWDGDTKAIADKRALSG